MTAAELLADSSDGLIARPLNERAAYGATIGPFRCPSDSGGES